MNTDNLKNETPADAKPVLVGDSGQSICCSCKYPFPDVWYGTYCATCGFDLPIATNVPNIAAVAELELQNFKLRTNEQ